MRGVVRAALAAAAVAAAAGCGSVPWNRGGVAEGLPKLKGGVGKDAAFHFVCGNARLKAEFEKAFAEKGYQVAKKVGESDFVVEAAVDSWTYNDAGLSGFGRRDEVEISVKASERRTRKVVSRAKISVRNDFGVIGEYAERFAGDGL